YGHERAGRFHPANDSNFAKEQVARSNDGEAERTIDLGGERAAAVIVSGGSSGPGDRGDDSRRAHSAHVARSTDIQVTQAVESERPRDIELGLRGLTAVTSAAFGAVAGEG